MLVLRSIIALHRRCVRPCARMLSVLYAPTHEYIKVVGDIGTVGITDHAAGALGDIVYVELPQVGATFKAGDSFGSVVGACVMHSLYGSSLAICWYGRSRSRQLRMCTRR